MAFVSVVGMKKTSMFAVLAVAALACGGSSTVGGVGGQAATGGNNTGGSTPTSCTSNAGCDAEDYCVFADGLCGKFGDGTCQARPTVCSDGVPVCACDGKTYDLGCAALQGVDADIDASHCDAPAGWFTCGDTYCLTESYFCKRQNSADGEIYSCETLPMGCDANNPDCACLKDHECGDQCSVAEGGLTVDCPG